MNAVPHPRDTPTFAGSQADRPKLTAMDLMLEMTNLFGQARLLIDLEGRISEQWFQYSIEIRNPKDSTWRPLGVVERNADGLFVNLIPHQKASKGDIARASEVIWT